MIRMPSENHASAGRRGGCQLLCPCARRCRALTVNARTGPTNGNGRQRRCRVSAVASSAWGGRGSALSDRDTGSMLIAHLRTALPVFAAPGVGEQVGVIAARTPWLGAPAAVWVQRLSGDGRWGQIQIPFEDSPRTGWIELRRARTRRVDVRVEVSRSRRTLDVWRGSELLLRTRVGVGAATSPTPTGRFVVSERVAPRGDDRRAYGGFAFGLSGNQPRPPKGWRGPAQMAIHGSGDPRSIGRALSAGCVRVTERALQQLRPLLAIGTPVVIRD